MIEERLTPYICPRFLTDERYREGHLHILAPAPGTKVLGLHTPEMKRVAKELVRSGEWQQLTAAFAAEVRQHVRTSLWHEERMVWGLMIDYAKVPLQQRIKLIDDFVPCIDNWAICDNFCCNAAWAQPTAELWQYLVGLMRSEREFTARVGIVLAMAHFLDYDHYQTTLATVGELYTQPSLPYYIQMAVAWLLATSLAKHEEPTRQFVAQSHIAADIVKLYVRKARESRITRNVAAL